MRIADLEAQLAIAEHNVQNLLQKNRLLKLDNRRLRKAQGIEESDGSDGESPPPPPQQPPPQRPRRLSRSLDKLSLSSSTNV